MSIQYINTGTSANKGDGDTLRAAFNKINRNFGYLLTAVGSTGTGNANLSVSTTPPTVVSTGTIWWNSEDGRAYIYYDDGDTAQWVDLTPPVVGPIGYTGSAGQDGADGYLGSRGDTGYTGSAGENGMNGSDGYTGSQGEQGELGYTGSRGEIGYTGSQGNQAVVVNILGGVAYVSELPSSGNTLADAYYVSETNTVWFWGVGDQWYDIGLVAGVQGPQGQVGYTGSRGFQGITGYDGSTGYTGSQGEIGYTGSQGDTGYNGSQGDLGYTGSQGEQGYTGSQGDTGYNGSQGEIGYTGSQGEIGYTGSQGETGYDGSTGYTGSQGEIGYTGSRGLQGVSVTLQGTKSTIGDLPAQPVDWNDFAGHGWIVTTGDGSTHLDGSLWFWNLTTGEWNDIGKIVGPQGDVGYTGSQGEIGYTGSQGPQGATGSGLSAYQVAVEEGFSGTTQQWLDSLLGYTGSQGDIGYTGSQGEIGYSGSQGEVGYTGSAGTANADQDLYTYSDVTFNYIHANTGEFHTIYFGTATNLQISEEVDPLTSSSNFISFDITGHDYLRFIGNQVRFSSGAIVTGGQTFYATAIGSGDSTITNFVSPVNFDYDVTMGAATVGTLWFGDGSYVTSASGLNGYTGSAGSNGYAGSQGDLGYTGSAGSDGYTGSQGEQGYTGSQGDVGYTGSASTEVGYTGSIGYTGSAGTSVRIIGSTATSADLTTFDPSPIYGDGVIAIDTGYLWVYTESSDPDSVSGFDNVGRIVGPTGYVGSQGEQGLQGDRGPIGYTGSAGTNGTNGYDGSIGYTGSKGDIGYVGSRGSIGPVGYTGSQGIPGAYAARGYTGSTGYTGSAGTNGYNGSTGYTGSQGNIGYTGSRGGDITNTAWNATTGTTTTLGNLSLRFRTGGILQTTPATSSTTFVGSVIYAVNGINIGQDSWTGSSQTQGVWTDVPSAYSMLTPGDTALLHLTDVNLGHVYRVVAMRTTMTGGAITIEQLI